MDILFKTDDYVFSYRIGGIVRRGDKYLLQRSVKDGACAFVGGHVNFGETHEQTLIREFREELHIDVTVGELMLVGELFFPWGTRPCHQIALYYRVDIPENALVNDLFHGYDEIGGERFDLDYIWVSKQQLPKLEIYPPQAVEYILSERDYVQHFIYRE